MKASSSLPAGAPLTTRQPSPQRAPAAAAGVSHVQGYGSLEAQGKASSWGRQQNVSSSNSEEKAALYHLPAPVSAIGNGPLSYSTFHDPFNAKEQGIILPKDSRWWQLAGLAGILFSVSFDSFMLVPLTYLLEVSFNMSVLSALGITAAVLLAVFALSHLPAPLLADTLGYRWTVTVGIVLAVVGSAIKAMAVAHLFTHYVWFGEVFTALALVLLMVTPAQLSSAHFPALEWTSVSRVCATAIATGTAMPFLVVLAFHTKPAKAIFLLVRLAFAGTIAAGVAASAILWTGSEGKADRNTATNDAASESSSRHEKGGDSSRVHGQGNRRWRLIESADLWNAVKTVLETPGVLLCTSCSGLAYGVFWSVLFALAPAAHAMGLHQVTGVALGALLLPVAVVSTRAAPWSLARVGLFSIAISLHMGVLAIGVGLLVAALLLKNAALATVVACIGALLTFFAGCCLPYLAQEHASESAYPVNPGVSEAVSATIVNTLGMLVPLVSLLITERFKPLHSAPSMMHGDMVHKPLPSIAPVVWVWEIICVVCFVIVLVIVRDRPRRQLLGDGRPLLLKHIAARVRSDFRSVESEGARAAGFAPQHQPSLHRGSESSSFVQIPAEYPIPVVADRRHSQESTFEEDDGFEYVEGVQNGHQLANDGPMSAPIRSEQKEEGEDFILIEGHGHCDAGVRADQSSPDDGEGAGGTSEGGLSDFRFGPVATGQTGGKPRVSGQSFSTEAVRTLSSTQPTGPVWDSHTFKDSIVKPLLAKADEAVRHSSTTRSRSSGGSS